MDGERSQWRQAETQGLANLRDRCFARVGARLFETGAASEPERYRVVDFIGKGEMGVVVSAWDTALERQVAIKKVVCASPDHATAVSGEVRETSVLASWSHPNVVTVYDVFSCGDEVSIVMELLKGQTLRGWLRSERREPAGIVAAFEQAGQGLAAAHRNGVVHCDFKPSNAIMGDDGRVRVVDFGIARLLEQPRSMQDRGVAPERGQSTNSSFVGTGRYAAPEQHRGLATAASDQFSLCLSLYEALCSEHPFEDDDAASARRRAVPSTWAAIPRRIRSALSRGLALRPEQRWPSVEAFLARLTPRSTRAWGWSALLGAGAVAVVAAWGPYADACAEMTANADEVWNQSRRAEIGRAFGEAELPHAAQAWAEVEFRVDAWVEPWHGAVAQVCSEADPDGGTAAHTRCLADALEQLDAFLEALEGGRTAAVESAIAVAGRLPSPVTCVAADPGVEIEGPSAGSLAVHRARSHFDLGDPRAALSIAGDALEAAGQETNAGALVDLLIMVGASHAMLGDPDEAMVAFERAAVLAAEATDDRRWLRAVLARVEMTQDEGQYEATRRELKTATTIAQRLPPDDPLQARVLSSRGLMARLAGDVAGSLALERAAAAAYLEHGDRQRQMAALANGANALTELGRDQQALEELLEASEVAESEFGPWHPTLAGVLLNLGNAYLLSEQLEEARAAYHRALAIVEASHIRQPELIATIETSLAMTFDAELEELSWRTHIGRAKLILESMPNPPQMRLSNVLLSYGNLLRGVGSYAEALEMCEQARRAMQATGFTRPEFAASIAFTQGHSLLELGRPDEAVAELEPALASALETLGRGHHRTTNLARVLARASVATGDCDRAVGLSEEFIDWETSSDDVDPVRAARARLVYAQALTATGELERARAQAEGALEWLDTAPGPTSREDFALRFEVRELIDGLPVLGSG